MGGGDTSRGGDGPVASEVGPAAERDNLSGCGFGCPGCEHSASRGSAREPGHCSSY